MTLLALLLSAGAVAQALDPVIDSLVKADKFSGVVLVSQEGKPVYTRVEGYANAAFKDKNRLETKFNLGSNNKMFTAVAIAQLQEAGKLAFDDKVTKFLPEWKHPETTLHQLLTHTAGLGSYFNDKFAAVKDHVEGPADILPFCDEVESPGKFAYSNCGFIVLGRVIEKVSGQSYDEYVKEHITGPAGMTDTRPYAKDEVVEDLAVGYTHQCKSKAGPRCSNVIILPRKGSSAGGGFSTAPDMLAFANALLAGKLVSAKSLELLTTGKVDMPVRGPLSVKYGYGFGDVSRGGLRSFGHEGGAPGILSSFSVYRDKKTVLIVFSNFDPDEGAGMEISRTLDGILR